MISLRRIVAVVATLAGLCVSPHLPGSSAGQTITSAPLSIHPENPHYFLWRGKPAILIGSGEHYGALLNLDFDYRKYFDTLAADGMMLTRLFSGSYVEPEGAFNIARNTLAPGPGRFISPWARSNQPGYANGGNRFDLDRWDSSYFDRLKSLATYAQTKGIVIEFTLFCPMYEDKQWNLSPMNGTNNINGLGKVGRLDVFTLGTSGGLLAVQEALTRKIVTELNPMDNVIFEIMNEPYTRGVTVPFDWQRRIAEIIVETERALPKKHLISQNIANKSGSVQPAHPAVSVFNFHYAAPEAVSANYQLNKVIGDNETGFKGTEDTPYRIEAWEVVMSGGGLFNHLDYSFAAGYESGTFEYPSTQPGGGNPRFRRQMRILRDFIHGFDFVRMRPDDTLVTATSEGVTARGLVLSQKAVAVFLKGGGSAATLSVRIPPGTWTVEWVDTKTGEIARRPNVAGGEVRTLAVPVDETDIALRLLRQ
jgi:hypothetical protein